MVHDQMSVGRKEKKARIMLVGPLSPNPIVGGIENGVRLYLRSCIPRQFDFHFFNTYRKPSKRSIAAKVVGQLFMTMRYLVSLLCHRPQLVHLKSSSGTHFYQHAMYAALAIFVGRRIVFQLHSGRFETFLSTQPSLLQAISRRLLERADYVICLSPYWKKRLTRLCPGCNPVIIPNAVDLDSFERFRKNSNKIRKFCNHTVLFIGTTVASLNRSKGLYDLLQALDAISLEDKSLRLILAGCDTDNKDEAEAIAAVQASGNLTVDVYGAVDQHTKLSLFSHSDIFLLPSYVENQPNTVLEAMAAGLPIIATRTGGVPDLAQEGVNGLLCQPGDVTAMVEALRQLLQDRAKRDQMGKRNVELIKQKYDSPKVHRTLAQLYEQAINGERVGNGQAGIDKAAI